MHLTLILPPLRLYPILKTYKTEQPFCWLMNNIGITSRASRNQIVQDGFNLVQSLVNMHTNDAEGFKKYLNILNKTFATATSHSGLRVYYSPVIIARFLAILHYYDQCINGYHTIPDINLVDSAFADKMIQTLKEHEESATMDSDDKEDVTIPTLQGSKNWVDFRDKFVLELSMIKSKRGFPWTIS